MKVRIIFVLLLCTAEAAGLSDVKGQDQKKNELQKVIGADLYQTFEGWTNTLKGDEIKSFISFAKLIAQHKPGDVQHVEKLFEEYDNKCASADKLFTEIANAKFPTGSGGAAYTKGL